MAPCRSEVEQLGCGHGLMRLKPSIVLFVDEAAQMSLANVLAVSHAARSVVLLAIPSSSINR